MNIHIEALHLDGCSVLRPTVHTDARGTLVKFLDESTTRGLPAIATECFWTTSGPGVVRGLHLQTDIAASTRVITCVAGAVFDVLLDLRAESATFGEHVTIELTAEHGTALIVAPGVAHGFATIGDGATLLYLADKGYAPESDTGVRWDSAGVLWPYADPLISARDAALPTLDDWRSS